MIDTKKILETLQKNPAAAGALGGLAGSLLGSTLGGGKGLRTGGLVRTGALAAVGYLAWQAWQRHQAQKSGGAAPQGLAAGAAATALPASIPDAFDLTRPAHAGLGLRVIEAMVAAARADGVLDPAERDRIFERVNALDLSREDHDYVLRLLTQPVDLERLVQGAAGSKELALEIYTAAALAVQPANRAERAWLDMLAARLELDEPLAKEADRTVESALAAR